MPKSPTKKQAPVDPVAEAQRDRTERLQRAAKAIDEICERERVVIRCVGFGLTEQGGLVPEVQLIARA